METLNVTKRKLLIDALYEFVSCRDKDERDYTQKGVARLALACDRSIQLFNLILHNIDLYKISPTNRRRNIRYYLMQKNAYSSYEVLYNSIFYINKLNSIRYDDIVGYINKSNEESIKEINEYFKESIREK